MPGATVDHIAAIIIFLVAILFFVNLFSQNIQTAVLYQQNSQSATEASNILDSISLNPGSLNVSGSEQYWYWGTTNGTSNPANPKVFGLQDPTQEGYVIDPFSLMRLNASNTGAPSHPSFNGVLYDNVTIAPSGGYLLVPASTVVSYKTASKLLGITGSYGFQLAIIPTLNITMSQTNSSPLRVTVTVKGSGLTLAGASLNYYLINSTNGQKYPKFQILPSTAATYTNAAGLAILNFSSVNAGECAYALIVYANLKGLTGVGYFVHTPSSTMTNKIVPVLGSFNDGKGNATVLLERQSSNTLYFNTTFLALGSSVSSVVQMSVRNGTVDLPTVTGLVSNNNPFASIQIPNNNQTGILVVAYNSTTTAPGISLLPWGISSLGVSIVFGSVVPSSSNNDWVTTDVRQVMIAGESYELKIALWSLAGIQAQGPSGGASI